MGPPGGTGPATAPGGMAGNQAHGSEKVKMGMKALLEALPMLPLGGELSTAVMKAVNDIGKHIQEGMEGDPQSQIQMLAMMARNAKAQPGQAGAVQGLMGGGGAPPPPGGGMPPGAPPPGAPPMGA